MKWAIFDVLAIKAGFVGAVVKFTITGKSYKKCIFRPLGLAGVEEFLYICRVFLKKIFDNRHIIYITTTIPKTK